MDRRWLFALSLLISFSLSGQPAQKEKSKPSSVRLIEDTPHLEIVSEWIRELTAFHEIYTKAVSEGKEGGDKILDGIRHGTRMKLELQTSVHQLKKMKLINKPFDGLLPMVIIAYQQKIELHTEANGILKKFIAPKNDIDYVKLVARMPEITATLEAIDKSLLNCAVLFFALLVDEKTNSKGQSDHLVITKAERKILLDRLELYFGDSLTSGGQNYNISTASVFRNHLLGAWKSADEPWE
jgi:hypothetical protein